MCNYLQFTQILHFLFLHFALKTMACRDDWFSVPKIDPTMCYQLIYDRSSQHVAKERCLHEASTLFTPTDKTQISTMIDFLEKDMIKGHNVDGIWVGYEQIRGKFRSRTGRSIPPGLWRDHQPDGHSTGFEESCVAVNLFNHHYLNMDGLDDFECDGFFSFHALCQKRF